MPSESKGGQTIWRNIIWLIILFIYSFIGGLAFSAIEGLVSLFFKLAKLKKSFMLRWWTKSYPSVYKISKHFKTIFCIILHCLPFVPVFKLASNDRLFHLVLDFWFFKVYFNVVIKVMGFPRDVYLQWFNHLLEIKKVKNAYISGGHEKIERLRAYERELDFYENRLKYQYQIYMYFFSINF